MENRWVLRSDSNTDREEACLMFLVWSYHSESSKRFHWLLVSFGVVPVFLCPSFAITSLRTCESDIV